MSEPVVLTGPLRSPRQMLGRQEYAGHASIHDDGVAAALGFSGGTIEGPTHFSQVAALAAELWGQEWFEVGCISAHYQNACYEGERVRASVEAPSEGARRARISVEKEDGTPVLTGTASVGPEHPSTEVEERLARLRPPESLRIVDRLSVGDRSAPEPVRMDFEQPTGPMYPFSLAEKLEVITEPLPWYTAEGGAASPWGRPVLPLEMASVLTQYTSAGAFPVRQPSVGLFVDQEIRMVHGPLFAETDYVLEREVLALSESRRTESFWVRTTVRDAASKEIAAVTLLNTGVLKESYRS
jgi:hypothetical protein